MLSDSGVVGALICNQLIPCPPDVDDADTGIFGEGAAEAGDEDLEAAGVEEVIVAPQVEEEVLRYSSVWDEGVKR